MLIPSIDLAKGQVVQLVQGETPALSFSDVDYWIKRFRKYPLVQLIDLDAAKGEGSNAALVNRIASQIPCQVGGGIRTIAQAQALIAAGARRVILGSILFHTEAKYAAGLIDEKTAAKFCGALGREQLTFSVDTRRGQVAVNGWRGSVPLSPTDAMLTLEPWCGAFLYTHVDTEGTMAGFPMAQARLLRKATSRQLIVAGGIKDRAEVDALDALRVDAVAGMAIYTGELKA